MRYFDSSEEVRAASIQSFDLFGGESPCLSAGTGELPQLSLNRK